MTVERSFQQVAGGGVVAPKHQIVCEDQLQFRDQFVRRKESEPATKLRSPTVRRTKQRSPERLDFAKELTQRRIVPAHVDLEKDEVFLQKLLQRSIRIRHGIQFGAAESAGSTELDQQWMTGLT